MSRKTIISILACLLSLLPILTQAQTLTKYEYWFDDNFSGRKSGNLNGTTKLVNTSIATDGLDNGVHKFSFRAKQSDGYYSAITSSLFLKRTAATSSQMEYWFDDNFDQRGSITIGNTEEEQSLELDLRDNTKFPMGFHKLNIRVTIEGEGESAIYSSPVLKLSAGKATSLEYWIDDDIAHSRTFEGHLASDRKDYIFVSDLDLGDISPGYHRLYCRAVSSSKRTTSAVTMMPIMVKLQSNIDAKITRYSISVDDTPPVTFQVDSPAEEVVVNRTLDTSTLDDGEHELYMTFWNDAGNSVTDKSKFIVDFGTDKLATPDPSTFKATGIYATGFTATWGKVNGALYYDILVKKEGGDYKYPAFNGGSTETSIEVTGLEPNTSYLFQVRARNENRRNNSDWSPSIPNTVKTTNLSTTPAALVIHSNKGFDGTEPLTLGLSYHYNVWIANKEDHPWQGSFYLKDGDEDIKAWYNIVIPKNSVRPLEFNYTPESVGSKAFVLYYQTMGRGSGIPVETREGADNIMLVQVISDPTYNEGLQLISSIDCPETILQGEICDIKTSVINNSSDKWSGTLYITDNGLSIEEKEVTLSPGKSIPLTAKNWSSETMGIHQIGVYYKSTNGFSWIPVSAIGFNNPKSVEVLGAHGLTDATLATITHVTKGLVPEEMTVGSTAFYYFRITDEQGNRLKGLRLLFKCTGNGLLRNSIETTTSGDDGIAVLCLETEGNEAIASRGSTVNLECTALLKEDNSTVQFYYEPSDGEIKLTVHQGTADSQASGFENVEKMKFTLDLGVSAKAGLSKYVQANFGVSLPLSLAVKFADDGSFKNYTYDAKLKGSASVSAGAFKKEELAEKKNLIAAIPKASAGVFGGFHYSYTTNDWRDLIIRFIMKWCDSYSKETDWWQDLAIKTLENWYESRRDDKEVHNFFFGGEIETSLDFKNVIEVPSFFPRVSKTPSMKLSELGLRGKTIMNFDCLKEKTSYFQGQKRTLYGDATSFTIKGDFDVKANIDNLLSKGKSWWSLVKNSYFVPVETIFNIGASADVSFSVNTEEYADENNKLKEISHQMSLTSGWEGSLDIPFTSLGASMGFSSTSSYKLTSQEDWATYVGDIANSSSPEAELVRHLYPNLNFKTLFSAPADIHRFWKYPPVGALEKLVSKAGDPSRFKLKDAFKLEHTLSSKVRMAVKIPIAEWLKFSLNVGTEVEIENKPTASYYSMEDKRFFPISIHPATSMERISGWLFKKLLNNLNGSFDSYRNEIEPIYIRMQDAYGTGSVSGINTIIEVPGLPTYRSDYLNGSSGNSDDSGESGSGVSRLPRCGQANSNQGLTHYGLDDFSKPYAQYIISRHPRLAEKKQTNICTFTLNFNDGVQNFDDGVQIRVPHYYPAGDLLGITEQGDTLFVVSEVINVTAFKGETELTKSERGEFEITGNVGIDDLTPFGLREDQDLDVYYNAPDSKTWQHVGPAGTPLKVDKLGAYMLGIPISNDTEAPLIIATLDEKSRMVHVNVSDNIGVRISTLQVLVNGELREVSMINQFNFELLLTEEEMKYMVVVDITVKDLADNEGRMFVVFNIDKPDNTEIQEVRDGKNAEIHLTKRTLTVDGASPEAVVTVYSVDGLVQVKARTDAIGHAEINLNSLLEGVYIVTLSDGKSKKFHVK